MPRRASHLHRQTTALCLLLLLARSPGAAGASSAPPVPPEQAEQVEQQARWLLRILAYDRNLRARAGSAVTIVVAARAAAGGGEAGARCQSLAGALARLGASTRVAGLPVRVLAVELGDIGPFAARLIAEHAVAVYACAVSERHAVLAHVGKRRGILMVGGEGDGVRGGLGVSIVPRRGQLSLVVNLPEARAQGADLDASLLRLAEVIQ